MFRFMNCSYVNFECAAQLQNCLLLYYCRTYTVLYCTRKRNQLHSKEQLAQSYFTWRLPNICRVELISTVAIIENGHYAADQVYFL